MSGNSGCFVGFRICFVGDADEANATYTGAVVNSVANIWVAKRGQRLAFLTFRTLLGSEK